MISKLDTGFRKRSCSANELERDDDSRKRHPALGQPRIILDAVAGCPAKGGPGDNGGIFAFVGDMKAAQCLIPQIRDESDT
jgi:hypothetical protein